MSKEERKLKSLEELREEHKDILENKAVQKIAYWRTPLGPHPINLEKYKSNSQGIASAMVDKYLK